MTHRTAPRLLVLALGGLAGALLGAAPAAAHTTLKQSDPAAGSTVQVLPEVVRLTFTDNLPLVPTVTVSDAAGTVVNSSPISPRGNTVLQPVKSTKTGKFTVTWELTSADGHKTSGSFAFTVTAAPSGAPSPTAPVVVTATPAPEAPRSPSTAVSGSSSAGSSSATSTALAVPVAGKSHTSANWLPWTAVTVVLLGGAGTIILLSRRRSARPPSA